MISILEKYDWQLTTQLLLVISISISIIFFNRLKKYSELLVGLPFSLSVGLSVYLSNNLIAYFFFSEILFSVSKIIYNMSYKQYNSRIYENIRYIFWIIIFFTYYNSFGTFLFNAVPQNTGIEFTFVVALLLSLVFLMILNFVLRKESDNCNITRSIGYEILSISVFSLKTIFIISDMTDSVPPKHHTIIDILIILFIFTGCGLALKFYKSNSTLKLKSVMRALVILSLLPLLIIGEHRFWDNFNLFSLLLVIGFIALELVMSFIKKSRLKLLLSFILICFISGIAPFGHILILFKGLVDSDNQVILITGIITSLLTISIISKRVFQLSYLPKES